MATMVSNREANLDTCIHILYSMEVKDHTAKEGQDKIEEIMSKNTHKIGWFILKTVFIRSILGILYLSL